MKFIQCFVLLFPLLVVSSGFSQNSKLVNLDFSSQDTILTSEVDSTSFGVVSEGSIKKLYTLQFSITDTIMSDSTGFEAVYIECVDIKNKSVIYSAEFTLTELQVPGFIEGWNVELPFVLAHESLSGPKKISVVLKSKNGALGQTHYKTIPQ